MVKMLEAVDLPNVFLNVDIGHLCITRAGPKTLEKISRRILHVHISETDTFAHTNSIIGTGKADIRSRINKLVELGIEDNCRKHGVPPRRGYRDGRTREARRRSRSLGPGEPRLPEDCRS
jgi:sugar phosphate isomerase/epimerase